MNSKATIFVTICAYRDAQTKPTIEDCIARSNHPGRLRFGVCNQYDDETFIEPSEFPNTRIVSVPYAESQGLGWARQRAQNLYEREDFVFQLDSHMRFKQGWDDYHVDLMSRLHSDGIEHPIITAAAPEWEPGREDFMRDRGTTIGFKKFFDRGTIEYAPEWMSESEQALPYVRGYLVSGHYLFAPGEFYERYRFDPEIYFGGEEASLTVRGFTLGFDAIHPTDSYVYHDYNRGRRFLHWLDHTGGENQSGESLTADERDRISTRRIRQLLQIQDYGIDLGNYGLGTVRTLDEWIALSGIDIRNGMLIDGTPD